MGVELGRIEGPSKKKDGETSKKQTAGTSSRGKDTTIGVVNSGHQASQPISVDYTPALQTSQAYAHPVHYVQPYQTSQVYFPTSPTVIQSQPRNSILLLRLNKVDPRLRDLLSLFNVLQPPELIRTMLHNRVRTRPSINMISIATIEEEEDAQKTSIPFIVNYAPTNDAFTSAVPFVIEVLAKEPYQDRRVPWAYGNEVANMEQEMSAMGITRSGRVYQEAAPLRAKKVTDQEAEAFMKVIKASEYKVVEQMGKSPAHISLLALLLSSEPHRNTLLKVLTAAQVPKDTAPDRIEETVNSIFSSQISFAEDELPLEGQGHLRALHIVCKCNNHVVGRVMIDNGSALNVCPVSTLKQMNVDMSRIRASKTTVRAFDGSRREVNGEIDLLIDVGPCSFSVTFQILEIPNAFSLLLGRPWIHAVSAVPSSLHQKLKFFVEGKLITVNGEEDYTVYKETAVPYISTGEDQNLPFHSFDTISVIRDYGEVGPSWTDRMIGKVLLKNDYIPGIGLGARAQGILRRLKWRNTAIGGDSAFAPPVIRSCRLVVESIYTALLHITEKLFRGISILPLSQFFAAPPQIMGGTSDSPITESDDFSLDAVEAFLALPAIYAVTEETSSRVHIRPVREDEELTNWTSVLLYSAIVADV
ncbi:hypothetical protein CRG98_010016 [Punica granatum]|uniref:G-patch domain-containing protein n=1 Tax=Punica granatum TaxID=22663 RepID=A0A2I0KMU0_PUNGR|nr:hypothetical protein CRG98_010016 [Punica granatum]